MLAGMNLFSGILVALLERQRTGQGQHVETSLLESQVAFLANAAYEHLMGFGTPGKWGSEHAQLVPYKAFLSADGWVVIGAGVQNLFIKLINALGRPELLEDPRFKDLPARLAHRDVVNDTIESLTQKMTTSSLVSTLSAAGVPCAPVATIDQVFANPQVRHRQMVVNLEGAQAERAVSLGSAIKYSGFEITQGWLPPPKLDEGGRSLIDAWLGGATTQGVDDE
jgi:crotonobetainyl-CoA:carnitine CoA-transferase CaiB-like acyl-CoA transferase